MEETLYTGDGSEEEVQIMESLAIESSSSDEDPVFVGGKDQHYFELPRVRGRKLNKDSTTPLPPPPPTKDLVYIPKEKLLPFKQLYEKQPQKIKEMLRVTFSDGKPIIRPPPLGVFVNRVRKLQDKKKNKKHGQKKKLRDKLRERDDSNNKEGGPKRKGGVQTLHLADVVENDTQLVHVDYPGRVVHVEKAIETMGGIGQITKVFNNVNKKLSVRFRPDDPWCNAVRGEASGTVGLLLQVRYRKPAQKSKQTNNEATSKQQGTSQSKVEQVDDDHIIINGVRISKSQILYEDNELLKQVSSESDRILHEYHRPDNPGHSYLRIPKNHKPIVDQKIRIETLGIVNKTYKFEGICDFQYLPIKTTKDGSTVSTRDQLFPVLGNPSENHDMLFVCDELFQGEDRDAHVDVLPPMMSRIDKPVDSMVEHMMDSDNVKMTEELKDKSGVIATTRARRNVYTIFHCFQGEKHKSNDQVPLAPLQGALEDVKKRSRHEAILEQIKTYFNENPIRSRISLEHESKISSVNLKYALPCVAYFATNGPWRALWIRFGYDPREQQSAFIYQTVDFRVPVPYKCFMEEVDKIDETYYIFRPNLIPPRGQMFYQLCHLQLVEINRLIEIASKKASNNELSFDTRFGWLKEGTFEYVRHIITQYIESHLEELGKISEHPTSRKFLADGELELSEKLLPRPRNVKRFRKVKSYIPKPPGTERATASSRKSRSKRKSKGKESSQWAYQGILEDLSIKEINKYGSRKDDDKEILDDNSLLSDDFDDESTSEEDSEEFEDTEAIMK